ncbi:hypothetical protein QWY14_02345 [Planococcus sp. N028]|uniref:Uncharacterized protein n=1 Tax=Planococcus shixiaomingii TaxID=3058393 RepID=A0ABT8MYS1_9BACL|nr:hypothetical protein [Planococcus sp. N028]MDN7240607.1 hypothetical protein [Planococcus sp. N028]
MNPVFFMAILFSLFITSLVCQRIGRTKANKWLRILAAFIVNSLILSAATALFYKWDVQTFHKQTDGLFGSLGILVLGFFIPINTLVNIHIMEYFRNKTQNIRD